MTGRKKIPTTKEEFEVGDIKVNNHILHNGLHNTFIFGLSFKLGKDTPEDAKSLLKMIKMMLSDEIKSLVNDARGVVDNICIMDVPDVCTPRSHITLEYYMYTKKYHSFIEMKDVMHQIVTNVLE